ncbi:hypothetical protein CKO42_20590 [Lamprobacter modestohalophilus]|uniref:Uncharacterized protein n=1 Tax=Lamprobacter modestohalophilus TaxID=1064514 RepID=A0A9X0WC17_9GAMM|nr:hypothetical protein [Lamprobacter modestohalophilus]MBK1620785.1 hypothetical protein [Lamprobacter modestohalophilus]
MKTFWLRLIIISSVAFAGVNLAGNSALMADNAERLVRTANEFVNAVVPKSIDGRYQFSGWVIGQEPTRRYSLNGLQWSPLAGDVKSQAGSAASDDSLYGKSRLHRAVFSPSALVGDGDYQSTISIGSVPAPLLGAGATPSTWPTALRRLDSAMTDLSFGLSDPPVTRSMAPLGGGSVLKSW